MWRVVLDDLFYMPDHPVNIYNAFDISFSSG